MYVWLKYPEKCLPGRISANKLIGKDVSLCCNMLHLQKTTFRQIPPPSHGSIDWECKVFTSSRTSSPGHVSADFRGLYFEASSTCPAEPAPSQYGALSLVFLLRNKMFYGNDSPRFHSLEAWMTLVFQAIWLVMDWWPALISDMESNLTREQHKLP